MRERHCAVLEQPDDPLPRRAFHSALVGSRGGERQTENLEPRTSNRTENKNLEPGTGNQEPTAASPPATPTASSFWYPRLRDRRVGDADSKETSTRLLIPSPARLLAAGAQVTRIWKDVFADVGVSSCRSNGERVFVHTLQVQAWHSARVRCARLMSRARWRFRLARGRVLPYAGAGMTTCTNEEPSDFAAQGEDVREGRTGLSLLAGVDVRVWRWVSAGGEVRLASRQRDSRRARVVSADSAKMMPVE